MCRTRAQTAQSTYAFPGRQSDVPSREQASNRSNSFVCTELWHLPNNKDLLVEVNRNAKNSAPALSDTRPAACAAPSKMGHQRGPREPIPVSDISILVLYIRRQF